MDVLSWKSWAVQIPSTLAFRKHPFLPPQLNSPIFIHYSVMKAKPNTSLFYLFLTKGGGMSDSYLIKPTLALPPKLEKVSTNSQFLFITFPAIWDLGVTVKHIKKSKIVNNFWWIREPVCQPASSVFIPRKEGGGPKGNRHRGEERREKTEEEPRTKFWIFQVSSLPPSLLLPWGKGGSRRREGKK